MYRALVLEAAQQALDFINGGQFTSTDDAIAQYFATRPAKVSASVNAETDKQLRATLTEGINAGESIPQLADRISNVFGALAGYRAERIARTETTSASTFATIQGWSQSGQVEGKEWFTAKDERVCPGCNSLDGSVIGLADNYFNKGDVFSLADAEGNTVYNQKVDYSNVPGPPLHVLCRCTLLPTMV